MNPGDFAVIRAAGVAEAPAEPISLPFERASARQRHQTPYVLSDELAMAVNIALAVDQPLLVTGEPGCGKTSLAWAVARQLGTTVEEFSTKSTSTARDLLYSVDTLRRFHDATVGHAEARDVRNYLRFEALGRAIRSATTRVVLIDEVDKAPRDFPNDLLNEIESKSFTVSETDDTYRQKVRHFVLITSNGERRLPDAFLRRCVYAHVAFPRVDALRGIVAAHCRGLGVSDELIEAAVERFDAVRGARLAKLPATSELIAWVLVLQRLGVRPEQLRGARPRELPALELLIKLREDWEQLPA